MEVPFPTELLTSLQEDPDSFPQKVLHYRLCKLYELGEISGDSGAEMLGCDPWDFYRLLSKHDFETPDGVEPAKNGNHRNGNGKHN